MQKFYFIVVVFLFVLLRTQARRQNKFQADDDQSQQEIESSSQRTQTNARKFKHSSERKRNQKQSRKNNRFKSQQHPYLKPSQPAFWWNTLLAIGTVLYNQVLSCAGGFFSGMTVGLNSLDKMSLQVQQLNGNEEEKKVASKILNTISDHHLFLVTLLVGNAMVLQWLPLVVHKIMSDWAAILTSTIAVVIVAEIVPMSATTGPQKVKLAYLGAPLVDIMIKVYYVIAYPLARGLDRLLGVYDTSKLKRRDFLALINQKKKNELLPLQISMINRIFIGPKFTSVHDIMTPIDEIFALPLDAQITKQLVQKIQGNEFSFVFIAQNEQQAYNKNFNAVVKAKQLVYQYLKLRYKNKRTTLKLKDLLNAQILGNQKTTVVYSDTGLIDALSILDAQSSRVALVHKEKRRKQGADIAYLDSADQIALHYPLSQDDSKDIVGVIFLEQVLRDLTDYNNQATNSPLLQRHKSPPKKRKLIKRASIMSNQSMDDL